MWEQEDVSNLKFVSLGRVASNLVRGETKVEITPFEILPDQETELNSSTVESEKQGVDFHNKDLYTVNVKWGSTIPAEWIGKTNSVLADDVRRGEQVRLFRKGDSQKWYWETLGRDDHLRRLETKIYRWNGNPENDDTLPSEKDSYQIEISTHDGHITLTTSDKNGEFTTFVFQINTKEGFVVIEDADDQHILLDTKNKLIEFINSELTHIKLDKTMIDMYAKDSISLKTKDYSLVSDSVTIDCKTYDLKAKSISMKADTGIFDIATMTFKGESTFTKKVNLMEPLASASSAKFALTVSALNI